MRSAGSRFDKQGEGRGVGVEKIAIAHRPEFARAEKSCERQRSKLFLDEAGIVVGSAKKP